MDQTVKDYLNPNERFAERLRRSMQKGKGNEDDAINDQQHLFVDDAKVRLKGSSK